MSSCNKETLPIDNKKIENQLPIDNSKNEFRYYKEPKQDLSNAHSENVSSVNISTQTSTAGCTVEKRTQSATFDKLALLDPTSEIMYIGSLLNGESIQEGAYAPFFLPSTHQMKPVTFSVSIQGSTGVIAKTITPTLSNFRIAMQDITNATINGQQPANFTFELTQARSKSEIEMSVGANLKFGSIFNSFANFKESTTSTKNYYLLKMFQKFFSADIDIPSDGNLFTKPADFQGPVAPIYISSIDYGRSAYLLLESSYDSASVHKSLSASFSYWKIGGGTDLSQDQRKVMEDLRISGTVIGGSSNEAVKTINGIEGFKDYVINSGNLTSDSRGEIIAYRLRNAKNHGIYKTMINGDYYLRDCSSLLLPLRRYYNGLEHLYTTRPQDELLSGYVFETNEGHLYRSQVPNTVPFHRYYNGYDHYYVHELGNYVGYKYEGIEGYLYKEQVAGAVPLHRYYNGKDHFYTKYKGNITGYVYERIAGYVIP
ncbi:thiol-activated cytolysin family protein [Sphingobacterium haloxyli]|nr:thiol-activated cytolysin family protein [Sphingobacterium haloxyli]